MRLLGRVAGWSLPTLVGGLLCFGVLQAQGLSLRGRVLDATGQPVAGQAVVLHRVTPAGGAEIARATSGADGRFVLRVSGDGGSDALYFAATLYDGALYIGAPFRGSFPLDAEYVLVVGSDSVAGASGSPVAGTAGRGGPGGGAGFAALVALLALAGGLGLVLARRRAFRMLRQRRELLIELATLEERYADRQAEPDAADPEAYRRAREALRARLLSVESCRSSA